MKRRVPPTPDSRAPSLCLRSPRAQQILGSLNNSHKLGLFPINSVHFPIVCVHLCMCIYGCVCVQLSRHVCIWRPQVSLGLLFLKHHPPWLLAHGLSPNQLGWLASVSRGSSYLYLSSAVITSGCQCIWLAVGIKLRSSCLPSKYFADCAISPGPDFNAFLLKK